jgi:glycosyltransferase involved in cell wall biosynthesis
MPDNNLRIAIVVPCYNESRRLPVGRFEQYIQSSTTEFVFVDDGSTDDTFQILKRIEAAHPDQVVIVSCGRNLGKGEAVRRGINAAITRQVDYVGFWDADLATPLEAISDFVAEFAIRRDCLMVFGARVQLLGRRIDRSALRHYLGRIFATVASLILRLPVYDTQCGAKLFRVTPATVSLFASPFHSRWTFDVEIIARHIQQVGSLTAASQIFELPLYVWKDVAGSKVKPRDFLIALFDMCRIYLVYGRSPCFSTSVRSTKETGRNAGV